MFVRDDSDGRGATYLVPMTYRSGPRETDDGLIGTAQHGVLGLRWIYDAAHDPVLVPQLVALIQGTVQAQMQSQSYLPDPTVTGVAVEGGALTVTASSAPVSGSDGTELLAETAGGSAESGGQLIVRLRRVLAPADRAAALDSAGTVAANWVLADDTAVRGVVATAHWAADQLPQS